MSFTAFSERIFFGSRHFFCCCTSGMVLLRLIIALAGLILFITPAASQIRNRPRYRFEADIGYGFPEAIGIKLKYGNQIQAGLVQALDSRGIGPSGLELYCHLGEKPRLLDQSPWYVMGGAAAYLFEVDYTKEYNYLLYPRAGRSFYISRNAGINIDIGPGFPLGRKRISDNNIPVVLFTGSLTIFIRF